MKSSLCLIFCRSCWFCASEQSRWQKTLQKVLQSNTSLLPVLPVVSIVCHARHPGMCMHDAYLLLGWFFIFRLKRLSYMQLSDINQCRLQWTHIVHDTQVELIWRGNDDIGIPNCRSHRTLIIGFPGFSSSNQGGKGKWKLEGWRACVLHSPKSRCLNLMRFLDPASRLFAYQRGWV